MTYPQPGSPKVADSPTLDLARVEEIAAHLEGSASYHSNPRLERQSLDDAALLRTLAAQVSALRQSAQALEKLEAFVRQNVMVNIHTKDVGGPVFVDIYGYPYVNAADLLSAIEPLPDPTAEPKEVKE